MEAAEYDKLNPDEIAAAVAGGTLSREEATERENARLQPRAEVLAGLPGAVDGPQESNTIPGPTTPAQLDTPHGTQDEPRDYQASALTEVYSPSGTEDEPRDYQRH